MAKIAVRGKLNYRLYGGLGLGLLFSYLCVLIQIKNGIFVFVDLKIVSRMDLSEKAVGYASKNVLALFRDVIEKAYSDGYKDGYQDGKEELPLDVHGRVEFIDLGLPSKTLWADGFLTNEAGEIEYFPYCNAESYDLPTKEQWAELQSYCSWHLESKTKTVVCIGPNGASIRFPRTGVIFGNDWSNRSFIYFWLRSEIIVDSDSVRENRLCAHWYGYHTEGFEIRPTFSGNMIPIRLIQNP